MASGPADDTDESTVTNLPFPGFAFVWERPSSTADEWDQVEATVWGIRDYFLL